MLLSAILIPVFNSAHLIGDAVGGHIGIMVVGDVPADRTSATLGDLAARNIQAWLVRTEKPVSPCTMP